MRAANAELAPLAFTPLAENVSAQVEEIKKLTDGMRTRAATQGRLLDQKAFTLAADPTESSGLPDREDAVPPLDFKPLETAVARLKASAKAYDDAAAAGPPAITAGKPTRSREASAILQGLEQTLTSEAGLPGRPWYRHLVYAPGLLTGYGAKSLPGVREAIVGRRWAEASDYIGRTAAVLEAAATKLDEATARLKG
jgi:N-acetylated-alpha-linked acidic dipeptidase